MFEEQNKNTNKKEEEQKPQKETVKKIKKTRAMILKENSQYIAPILLNFNILEENKKLEEMLGDLEIFRKDYKEKIQNNIIDSKDDNSTNSTKLLIYNALEKNLIEISYIANKEIRTNRINSLYLWYKERNKISEDLRRINVKSYKEKDEINEEDLEKNEENGEKEENEEEKNQQKEENDEGKEEKEGKEGDEEAGKSNKKTDKSKKIHFKKINNRNEDLINKKMLDEYQRKILSKSVSMNNLKDKTRNNLQTDEHQLDQQTKSVVFGAETSTLPSQDFWAGDYSSIYSFKYGTNMASLRKTKDKNEFENTDLANGGKLENTFFPKFHKSGNFFPPLTRETKYSYSYYRPPYIFSTMQIENGIKDNKLKVLAEKRSQEEIKENLDKFGEKRAKYKEIMNNKYELKSVINMYVNSNDFNSPMLEKYKIKGQTINSNKHIYHNVDFYQTMTKPMTHFTVGVSNINKVNNMDDNKNIEDFDKLLDEQKIGEIAPGVKQRGNERKTSRKLNNMERSGSVKLLTKNIKLSGMADKIRINEIKNIDQNTKNILEQNKIKKIKVKIKLPKEKMQTHMINSIQKMSDKISSDIIPKIMSNDTLFRNKKTFENICNVNISTKQQEKSINDNKSLYSISKDEEESSYHNFCLSMYDPGNLKKINDNTSNVNKYYEYNKINRKNIKDSKIHFNQLHHTFHLFKDNFLNLRRTMSDWKAKEYLNLVNEMKKNNKKDKKEKDRDRDRDIYDRDILYRNNSFGMQNLRSRKQMSLLNAIMNPKDEFGYSQYFLPRTGSMLLSRMEEIKTKKKK
jgi:hypothetical protein